MANSEILEHSFPKRRGPKAFENFFPFQSKSVLFISSGDTLEC